MKFLKFFFVSIFTVGFIGFCAVLGLYFYVKPELPSVETLRDVEFQTPMQVYSADGKLISQFGEHRRIPVTFEELPQDLIDAVLATEDARFYDHFGVDPIGVMRAVRVLITTGSAREGASTITMQVARNFFLSRDKVLMRKIKETFIALHIERLLSKQEILALYMNKPGLGHRAFGVAAAAEVYYGRKLDELTLAELATIAGLFQAPSALNPISNPERSVQRRRIVLGRMLAMEYITEAEYEQAYNAPVTARYHVPEVEMSAPYIAEMVRTEMIDRYGEDTAYNSGMKVYTTVHSEMQAAAEASLRANLHEYDERHGYRGAVSKLWGYSAQQVRALRPVGPITETALAVIRENNGQRWSNEDIVEHLDRQPRFGRLIAAVVLSVGEQDAEVMMRGGEIITLPWEAMSWARPYLDHDDQGPAPSTAGEILASGDQIWLREVEGTTYLAQLPGPSSAIVSLKPQDGALQAVVGGYSFNVSQYNRATQAQRQVGSTIKPFIYATALDHGFTLSTLVNDAPITQWNPGAGSAWRPRNSPEVYDGPIRLREALARSKNVVSVRLVRAMGVETVRGYLPRFGFNPNDLAPNETIALGSASFTPLAMSRAFSVFANGGFLVEPYFIDRIENSNGETIFEAEPVVACLACEDARETILEMEATAAEEGTELEIPAELQELADQNLAPRVLSRQTAYLVSNAMESSIWGGGSWAHDTGWNGTAWRAQVFRNRDMSGKTGTTNDVKDAWFSGFVRGLVSVVWVGFDSLDEELGRVTLNSNLDRDRQPIVGSESGGTTALPAWVRYMETALPMVESGPHPLPDGIVSARIDEETGQLSTRNDYTSMFEYFKEGTAPSEFVEGDNSAPLIFEDEDEGLF
ncbi:MULTISPECIES: penicillin-binding protein 1A [Gammaproteobacteria]|uniref:penicillin-binding protein 1A n=1 Tax=Aliidiomarina sp. B3213 TaxID=2249757 RepID=UPI000DCFA586|nr:PBP1A family penicillin-binding protein [Aliidiomarina sp. B3213]TCZ90328.1 PBP1A family penicillin-binding protein [Lysobacter sp. N42]